MSSMDPLRRIRLRGTVFTLLTPDKDFLIGHSDGQRVAFFFTTQEGARAYLTTIGKVDHSVTKEPARPLVDELLDAGIAEAFVNPVGVTNLPVSTSVEK